MSNKEYKCSIPFYALIEITVSEESKQDAIQRAVQTKSSPASQRGSQYGYRKPMQYSRITKC